MDLVTPSIGLIVWQTVIFVLLILFLSKIAWRPIIKFIDQREDKIKVSIETADRIQKELEMVEYKKDTILKETRRRRDLLLKEAIEIQKKIKYESIEKGLNERKRMIEETKKNIKEEKRIAILKLKNQVGNISIKIAENILKQKFSSNQTRDKQEKYIKELINKI
ncbi:F0F1 ATP synthase subunit B [Blattabacterium cuenoti]|uniref:F0F1 ATP synthase subunit B n=1 Tax=Blattabacterium cuenoti TaxID=1653831 RepID=UPI00163D06FC|nr:F0F1 ATP synthase subunit B [Blattabacterium cuenoti]